MKKFTASVIAAFSVLCLLAPVAWGVGPLIEGFMVTQAFGSYRMSIPDGDADGGISHDLNAGDWVRFRVKVTHEDSTQASFASDGFSPTNNNIQLCTVEGCESLPIDLGNENLDWTDGSKIDFYLEAKECVLCSWTPFEVAQQ